jgi:hypothetical protein
MGWKDEQDLTVGGNGQPVVYEFAWASSEPVAPEPVRRPPPVIDAGRPRGVAGVVVWTTETTEEQ